jgi:pimeloyl-ACP methyl ester carboxylesterase
MRDFLKKLHYGARVLLSRGGGQEETVALPGREIVLRHGGDGPPLVYLHSAMGEGAMWLPFFQTWSKRYHVYVPLHPGFGKSGGFDRIDTIEDMAFHYAELIDALGLETFVLGGHSLGGWIAAEYALRWPERVQKLFISCAPGLWVDDQPLPDLFRLLQHRDKIRELVFHDPNGPIATMIVKDQPDEAQLIFGMQAMSVLARLVWRRPYNPRLAERLYRITCPTLLIWGDDDRLVPLAYGEAYRRYLPHAELAVIRDCGHLPMFEKEAEYVDRVLAFLSRP